jgi:hypothetical protein
MPRKSSGWQLAVVVKLLVEHHANVGEATMV